MFTLDIRNGPNWRELAFIEKITDIEITQLWIYSQLIAAPILKIEVYIFQMRRSGTLYNDLPFNSSMGKVLTFICHTL